MTTTAGYVLGTMRTPASVTVAATNGGGGPTTVTVPADDYTPVELCAALRTALNASRTPADWTVTLSTTTGLVTIGCAGSTPFSITWTSTELRDALGFTANISAASTNQTGTKQARFLWIPDAALMVAGSPKRAPLKTDARATRSPRGVLRGFVGPTFYRHEKLTWSHVAIDRVWEAAATVSNNSWETFVKDAHLAQGHEWGFAFGSIHVVDHAGNALGADLPVSGWQMQGVVDVDPRPALQGWDGLWTIEIPSVVSSG